MEHKEKMKKLIYNLYVDILNMFKKYPPIIIYGQNEKIEYEMMNYYIMNKKKIEELSSYKNLITEISILNNKDRGNNNSMTGCTIIKYLMKVYLETLIPLKLKNVISGYNLNPVDLEQFPFNYDNIIKPLCNGKSLDLLLHNKKIYFRYIENFDIDTDQICLSKEGSLIIRKLTENDNILFKKSCYCDENNNLGKYKVILQSDSYELINDENIKYIVGLLRIYFCGDFRVSPLYNLAEDCLENETITKTEKTSNNNTYNEPELTYSVLGSNLRYILNESKRKEILVFYDNNKDKIKDYGFALEYLNNIASINLKLRIPFLFMIIESFFEVNFEISYKIALISTKLLKKDISFMDEIKNFYNLRSKIAHGDKNGIDKALKKLKNKNFISEENLSEAYNELYKIMTDIWKKILELNLESPRKLVEKIENELIN